MLISKGGKKDFVILIYEVRHLVQDETVESLLNKQFINMEKNHVEAINSAWMKHFYQRFSIIQRSKIGDKVKHKLNSANVIREITLNSW